jgi:[FeFe] hydrogenase H-cluster maturation GTPase HydF
MEIPGLGAVVLIDTAGIDDIGELGKKRISKTLAVIEQIDMAVLVITNNSFDKSEQDLINRFKEFDIPIVVVHNKKDIQSASDYIIKEYKNAAANSFIDFSVNDETGKLIDILGNTIPKSAFINPSLFGDLINRGDNVLLITPIDTEAPEGRMILPQVQAIRDILDNNAVAITLKETEIEHFLSTTGIKPKIAVTDSQVFPTANALIPKEILLTSFSIMLARFKGAFEEYKKGTPQISNLKDGDTVLILESCTHHVTCDDIGRFKLPNLLKKFTGKQLQFEFVQGLDKLPRPITDYALAIQCGGCVITRKQLLNRLKPAIDANIPISNYGMALAYLHGIYERAMEAFDSD